MSSTRQSAPTSQLRFGHARADITPPVGIYHPMWGAARHHRATGIHRPLYADIMVFAPQEENGQPWLQAQLDMVGLGEHERMVAAIARGTNFDPAHIVVSYSHTHAGGLFNREREALPGGELIAPYLAEVEQKLSEAAANAVASLAPATITYATGRCNMAANRDFWDEQRQIFACGFNPDAPADDTLLVGRVTAEDGSLRGVVVNYACHPTTLAWDNTEISPDYVGALREEVERATGAPCIFVLGACGDLGPRQGFVGDQAVADANGRQVAYATLATLTSMDPPGQDFVYQGPVISGATVGTWAHEPFSDTRQQATRLFDGGALTLDLAIKSLPSVAQLEQEMADHLARQAEADAHGDKIAARDYGARAERARRWIGRVKRLPQDGVMPYDFSVRRMGDAFWVSVGGEPYNVIQTTLRARFPDHPIVMTVLAGSLAVAYLLPQDRYGLGLYQEEPSCLAPGCLEQVTEAVGDYIEELARVEHAA